MSNVNKYLFQELKKGIPTYEKIRDLINNPSFDPNDTDTYGNNLLMLVSEYGLVDVVEVLLKNGANPNNKNSDGRSPIMFASIRRGHSDVVEVLLEYGANPNDKDNYGNTALIYAFKDNDLYTIKVLLDYGAEIGNKEKLILKEASHELQEEVKKILDQKRSMLASYIIQKEMLNGQYMDANSENDLAEYMGAKGGRKRRKQKSNKNKRKSKKNKRHSIKRRK